MDTREMLLRAVIANPEDDAPRLAMADFFEDASDSADRARCELIRYQIETARLPDDHPDKADRIRHAVRVTDEYKARWFGWVRDTKCLSYPHRGFLDHWSCGEPAEHRADLADAFRREPITSATLFPDATGLRDLATWPQLSRLRKLKLWPGEPAEGDVRAFVESLHLTGLREFEYMGNRGTRVPLARALRVVSDGPQYAGLTSLSILSAGVGNRGAGVLARASALTRLTSLSLVDCDIGRTGMGWLLASPVVAGVTNLGFGGDARTPADGQHLAEALAASPHLSRLTRLALVETAISDRAAGRLARADWPALRDLTVSPLDPHDSAASTALAAMTAAGMNALAEAPWFAGLEVLNLDGHAIGDAGAIRLAAARLPGLRWLSLMRVGVTAVGLRALVAAYAERLDHLQLYGNPLGDTGAEAIAAAAWPRMVPQPARSAFEVGLFLGGCDIGKRGNQALRQSKSIPPDIPTLFVS